MNFGSGNSSVFVSTKLLSEPMLTHCQLDPLATDSVKIKAKYNNFHWTKCFSKLSSAKYLPFFSGPHLMKLVLQCMIILKSDPSKSARFIRFIKLTEPQRNHKFAVVFCQVHCYCWTLELYTQFMSCSVLPSLGIDQFWLLVLRILLTVGLPYDCFNVIE